MGGRGGGGGGGGATFPYILLKLNPNTRMFSQLAKRLARVLPADLCTSHALYYVKSHSSTVLKRRKTWRTKVGLFIIFW